MLSSLLLSAGIIIAVAAMPDSALKNVSEVLWSGPENRGVYLGSPSIIRCTNGDLLVTHDLFGSSVPSGPKTAYAFVSSDQGQSWIAKGTITPMYWSSLFSVAEDSAVYLLGTTNDGHPGPTQIVIAKSNDCGTNWETQILTDSTISYSTGPTPILVHGGRLWRAFELNVGPEWAAGYAALVISCAMTADLMDPTSWTISGSLPFSSVRSLVPSQWTNPALASNFGWLEGNAVAPLNASDSGVNIVLRVNSLPAANKAALLYVPSASSTPVFQAFLEFPGGMSKFSVRKDSSTGVFVTISNNIQDDSISFPPVCGSVLAPTHSVGPCSMGDLRNCVDGKLSCLWAHGIGRNNLTLAFSRDGRSWTVGPTVMSDDSGSPEWLRQIFTGFQYVDWQFDGEDIIAAVRAAYRGADCYHNSNRILFQRIVQWKRFLPSELSFV